MIIRKLYNKQTSNLRNLHTHTHTALKFEQIYQFRNAIDCRKLCFVITVFDLEQFLQVMLNVLGCQLTYQGQAETNAWAWLSIALRPRKPEGSLGRTAQDGQLDSHTASELWCDLEQILFAVFHCLLQVFAKSAALVIYGEGRKPGKKATKQVSWPLLETLQRRNLNPFTAMFAKVSLDQ